jgi:hypothetical protein
MSEVIKILEIAAWPFVAILAICLFRGGIQSFLRTATLKKVNIFGVEIETTGAELAQVVWDNFGYFKPTNLQWSLLVRLAEHPSGIPKADADKMGLDYKDDLRPLRNAGLMTGNAATINRSDLLRITPLGKFVVTNARNRHITTADVRSIEVRGAAEEDQ